jgi:drug/metabolite transporter superfamily protein YnfA
MIKSTFSCRRLVAAAMIPFHLAFIIVGLLIMIFTIILTTSMSEFSGRIIAAFGHILVVYMYLSALFVIGVHAFGIKVCHTLKIISV